MMLAARVGGLEARDAVAEVDPLNEPELVEALERPVDACDPDPGACGADAVVDLLCGEAAVLARREARRRRRRAPPLRPLAARRRVERRLGPRVWPSTIMIPVLKDVLRCPPCCARGSDLRRSARLVARRLRRLDDDAARATGGRRLLSARLGGGADRRRRSRRREPHAAGRRASRRRALAAGRRDDSGCDLVIYVGGGFQPAVEDAVAGA